MKPIFIAEIKTQSPYGFKSDKLFCELAEIACHYGDWVGVHTGALFSGCKQAIDLVRKMTDKPIFAKGFHTNDEIPELLARGATYALMVDEYPNLDFGNNTVLVEWSSDNNPVKSHKIVWNSRDLRTGKKKDFTVLDRLIKQGYWVCQASNIKSPTDVREGVSAFIVGSYLPEFTKHL